MTVSLPTFSAVQRKFGRRKGETPSNEISNWLDERRRAVTKNGKYVVGDRKYEPKNPPLVQLSMKTMEMRYQTALITEY
ncbi:hypothetical protein E2R67_11155 [Psychromonas sp. RZ5]|nr:hypothetical protein E2R67_11155 [Psychromonas sp. RZ5]